MTGEIKKKAHVIYPNVSGVLATAGGLVFTGLTDGSIIAYDDETLEPLWKFKWARVSMPRR
jgi:alcohol dehydrogenase (cytochrome c)